MALEEEIYNNFVQDFSSILRGKVNGLEISKLIFLCVGTDRVIGDSFGPLVGYKLKNLFKGEEGVQIVGGLDNIICTQNIEKIIDDIKNTYELPFIIAIDAALSNKTNIGKIVVSENSMNRGKSLNNSNVYAGDVSIKGIVAKNFNNPRYNFKILQNTSLNLIINMADIVSKGIYNVINI